MSRTEAKTYCSLIAHENTTFTLEQFNSNDFFKEGRPKKFIVFKEIEKAIDAFDYYLEKNECYFPNLFEEEHFATNTKKNHLFFVNKNYSQFIKLRPANLIAMMRRWPISDFSLMTKDEKLNLLNRLISSSYDNDIPFVVKMISNIILTSTAETLISLKSKIDDFQKKKYFIKIIKIYKEYLNYLQFRAKYRDYTEIDFLPVSDFSVNCQKIYRNNKNGDLKELDLPWSYNQKIVFENCIFRPQKSESKKILYYFISNKDSYFSFVNNGTFQNLINEWKEEKKEIPIIFALKIHDENFFTNDQTISQLDEIIIPQFEFNLGLNIEERMGLAKDEGGGKLLHALVKYPKLFTKVSILCPLFESEDFVKSIKNLGTKKFIDSHKNEESRQILKIVFGQENHYREGFDSTVPIFFDIGHWSGLPAFYMIIGENPLKEVKEVIEGPKTDDDQTNECSYSIKEVSRFFLPSQLERNPF